MQNEENVSDQQKPTESWLTSPSDRDRQNPYKPDASFRCLTREETDVAVEALVDRRVVDKFPAVDRVYCDPPIPTQIYNVFSFVPSSGAKPDKDGIYGFGKVRGSYQTTQEADERIEYLIRTTDSANPYFLGYVGRPFPITTSNKFSADHKEIDIRKKTTEEMSANIKQQKMDEQRQIREIKDREKMLKDDTTNKKEDNPFDRYTELRVKKAHLTFTYLEHAKKLAEIKDIIIKTRQQIADMDAENSDYNKQMYDRYMNARKESGLAADDDSFIRYLNEDADLGF